MHLVTMCYLKRDNVVRKNTAFAFKSKPKKQINKTLVFRSRSTSYAISR